MKHCARKKALHRKPVKRTAKHRQPHPAYMILFILTAVFYFGMAIYFSFHLLPGTTINNIPFSNNTCENVTKYFRNQIRDYQLTLQLADGSTTVIDSASISLTYDGNKAIQTIFDEQPVFAWPAYLWRTQHLTVPLNVTYNIEAMDSVLLSFVPPSPEALIPSASAEPEFNGDTFVIKPEVYGNEINPEQLRKTIDHAVTTLTPTVNLLEQHCYQKPKYTSNSKAVQEACRILNQYCSTSITYQIGNQTEVIDKSVISSWLTWDENMNVSVNRDAVTAFYRDFGTRYDTLRSERTFTTPTGKNAVVSGGTYGWSVDEAAEIEYILSILESGQSVTKEPAYVQTAAAHANPDWGNTYIEVDLTEQHMWYLQNNTVVFECDVVTGEPIPEKETPTGVFFIMEKLRNKTLIGAPDPITNEPSYRQPVKYWARVTGTGIGFHDADWQTAFGGSRYLYYGSHGCINMRPSDAAAFYDMISVGDPVIIHN